MSLLSIDGHKLKKLIISAAKKIDQDKEIINSLNVFPVPDGDTGINMAMTVMAAANSVINFDSSNISEVAKIISTASLKEARGNSGVILSQLFRGFSQSLSGKETANSQDIADAFTKAMQTAYKAVMKPKEGTILTISKALSDKAQEKAKKTQDIRELMIETLEYANSILEKTVNMLPELKQANVVDAGGKGLLTIIEGAIFEHSESFEKVLINSDNKSNVLNKTIDRADIKFGYCTEFFINIENYTEEVENSLKEYLQLKGDSIVVVGEEDFIKVHVHTNNPGEIIEKALTLGTLDKIKIENMRIQHTNLINFNKNPKVEIKNYQELKEFGFICVSNGEGFNKIFKEYGVDEIIAGGQTMNPSTQDFLNSIEKINAKNIFILPNNKNIILSAQQAAELSTEKNIVVINTKTIPEAYAALINFFENKTVSENTEKMNTAIKNISTGQVTIAVRNIPTGELKISKGDYISIIDGDISIVEKNLELSAKKMAEKMISNNKDASLLTIYYGREGSLEGSKKILEYIKERFLDIDIEIIEGLQPVYHYIISLE